ncbi:efflux RND transporter permease subunit [Paraburkholderia dinghuensis]|uniref:Uncharacterized protein n=1 Tax=Paraburkholderia dinghuensis TaxID=2305225 RepID=A0A3N6MLG8_9BURK|nr:hypothetical protein D1Y85_18050 [Paraburkholderia dinghuensis]
MIVLNDDAQRARSVECLNVEEPVNGAYNTTCMYSLSSSTGNLALNVFFEPGANRELTQVDVQNRVPVALPQPRQSGQSHCIHARKKSSEFIVVQVSQ